jgi:hypothetical protein
MVYYNSTYPQYRYKFFAYYLDSAEVTNFERYSDRVIYDIEINGTQNLMCACASLTEKQKKRFSDSPVYPYSAATGALGLFPTFKMESQLASLHFALSDDSAEGVSIRNIEITAPYKGRFVVAAADEKEMGITFDTETTDFTQSFKKEGAMFFLPAADNYVVTIGDKIPAVLDVDDGFKAGMAYTVEVKVNDSENIEFEVK